MFVWGDGIMCVCVTVNAKSIGGSLPCRQNLERIKIGVDDPLA